MFMFVDLVGAVEQLNDNDIFTDKTTRKGGDTPEKETCSSSQLLALCSASLLWAVQRTAVTHFQCGLLSLHLEALK